MDWENDKFIRKTPLEYRTYRTKDGGIRGESNFYIDEDTGELVDLNDNKGALLLESINVTPYNNSYGETRDYNNRLQFDKYGNYYPYTDAGMKENLDQAGRDMYDALLMLTPTPSLGAFPKVGTRVVKHIFTPAIKVFNISHSPGDWLPAVRTAASKLGKGFNYLSSKFTPSGFLQEKFARAANNINKGVSATKEVTKYPRHAINNGMMGYWSGELFNDISPDNPWYVNAGLGAATVFMGSPFYKSYKIGKYNRGVANKYITYPYLSGLIVGSAKENVSPTEFNTEEEESWE